MKLYPQYSGFVQPNGWQTIPGLDGSRFVFLLIEAIRRKPISKNREAMVHFIGMAALFLLMILVTVQDIGRFFKN